MENSSPFTENLYSNDAIYEKCHDILVSTTVDVNFLFETENDDVVKVSANKACLAAPSPVFSAMFNGELREEGDIKMVDVSAAAFKEFLQFFYERKVKLTLNNIFDVIKLIDKYDIAGGFPICVHFLKETLTIEDIVWGLQLAIQFRLDELKTFCIDKIQNNYKTVLDTIRFGDDGKVITSNARLTEIDWNAVLPHILMASQSVIRTISQKLDDKCAIYSVTLSSPEQSYEKLTLNETTVFSLSKSMMLTDIVCSKISKYSTDAIEHPFTMTIERKKDVSSWHAECLYQEKVNIAGGNYCVKLGAPVLIEPNYLYAINFQSDKAGKSGLYTYTSIVQGTTVELAPNVNISFKANSKRSLISVLYFIHLTNINNPKECVTRIEI